MAQRDERPVVRPRIVFLVLIAAAAFIASTQHASAACYRLLQPNGWGYQTVCTNSGGGGGGGGAPNYGAALGAAAGFLGALQDLINENPQGSPEQRQSSCEAGYRVISGGGCAPTSAVDCGGGVYCSAGNVCIPGNKCQSAESIEEDRQYKLKWERAEQGKRDAALAELDEIKKQLARPQEAAKPSVASLPPKQANPFSTSGASNERARASSTVRRPWVGGDCSTAGRLERNTAAWFDMCGPKPPPRLASHYVPSIDPQRLRLMAKATCGSVAGENQHRCIMDNKLQILLRDDPGVRRKCSSLSGEKLLTCVDLTYLYGPSGPSYEERRAILFMQHPRIVREVPSDYNAREFASAPPNECKPGFGMKPTPGAFGAYSCQKLGVIFLAPDRNAPIDEASREGVERVREFEEHINELAAAATAAAVKAVGGPLNEADRNTCTAASFGAARGALKGGATDVPDRCRPMALAAQIALAQSADADNRVRALNPGVEELLRDYAEGANPLAVTPQTPQFIGLELTEEERRQADCIARGGGAIECASPPGSEAPAPPPARVADACVQAEAHWRTVEEMRTIALYQDHLARFPSCAFAALAAARIEQLSRSSRQDAVIE